MFRPRGICWLEVILVKIVLLGTAFGLRSIVRDTTADTLARANDALRTVSPETDRIQPGSGGGLPDRAQFIGGVKTHFPRKTQVLSHPSLDDPETPVIIRVRNPFCGT